MCSLAETSRALGGEWGGGEATYEVINRLVVAEVETLLQREATTLNPIQEALRDESNSIPRVCPAGTVVQSARRYELLYCSTLCCTLALYYLRNSFSIRVCMPQSTCTGLVESIGPTCLTFNGQR